MNEGVPINLEHWIQIITTILEITNTNHSFNQTTDKRIITPNTRSEISNGYNQTLMFFKTCVCQYLKFDTVADILNHHYRIKSN
jgi:hypothetical protein